ncbi:hypothetical protein B0G38_004212 [Arthrobacter sp. VKM Ac-2550]|nr:hypothetical protein [Arthrobacter sp. VKM Ac-2550]
MGGRGGSYTYISLLIHEREGYIEAPYTPFPFHLGVQHRWQQVAPG